MPGDLYVGGGVHMPIAVTVDYWPVAGVTKPQHLWPFNLTGDYTDQGSEGNITLTAQGSGNSFDNGLKLNGSGWAQANNDADLCDLGSTWSVLFEGDWSNAGVSSLLGSTDAYDPSKLGDGWYFLFGYNGTSISVRTWNPQGSENTWDKTSLFTPGTNYQIVITLSGGTVKLYIDGTFIDSTTLASPTSFTGEFTVGVTNHHGSYPLTGTIKRAGVLKGTAWSADDVAAIYAAL